MQKPPKLEEYNEKGDPDKHMKLINDQLNYYCACNASQCKQLELTMVGPTQLWFNILFYGCVDSWTNFAIDLPHILPHGKTTTIVSLICIMQGEKESM